MRVVIVCPVFPPEPVTSARTSADLAAALAARGHEVTVITSSPSRPGGRLYAGYRRGFARRERSADGYTVLRTWSVLPRRSTALARLMENLSFGWCAMLLVLSRRADVVFQNSWPIFASGMVAFAAWVRRAPLVMSVQDVHPEAAVQSGKVRSGATLVRILQALDGMVARRADSLVAISQPFAEVYRNRRRVAAERVHVVPNWMDEAEIVPGERAGTFRAALGIDPRAFVALYAGNVGEVSSVDTLVAAAALLRDDPAFMLAIVGDGARRAACEELATGLGVDNVRFHYPWLTETPADVHAAADLLLLPTLPSGALHSAPSKLIGYMLSGRAIVAAVDAGSETARVVLQADCGVVVPPGDPASLAAAIRGLRVRRCELDEYGARARRYAEEHFARGRCVPRMVHLIEQAAGKGHMR